MNLVIIGAQASGKMTIGQEVEKNDRNDAFSQS